MNRIKTDRAAIDSTAVDRILANGEELIPSSGFAASVMERIQEEAAAPPPIPFPWKRAVLGMILAAGVFGWGAVEFFRAGIPAWRTVALTVPSLSAAQVFSLEQAGWVALALGVSLASWLFSRRLAGQSGLL